ncbi:MAG TPA: hypothetical protein VE465_19340 [Streptosporangiaceae bacterium]|jgi:hypothetical protein|nr:hypothetical protein [Streptosporangiaceae bacterium]
MDDQADLRQFAELLMRLVRDQAIASCDALAAGRMGGASGNRWRELLADERTRQAVRTLIPEIVDEVLFYFVNALDADDLPLAWRREDGSYVDLYELGGSELGGDLMVSDGWRAQYSSQRFFAPGADSPS